MKKGIGKLILFLFGWKVSFPTQFRFPKMLMLAAPHTSEWDIFFTCAAYWKEGVYPRFLIHKKYTKGLLGLLLRPLGAIAVDPKKNENLVDFTIRLFNESSTLLLVITPEGSKKRVDKWKTGFFHIATKADVPISLGTLDYEDKIAGIGGFLNMSGNFEKDMAYIENFYKDCKPKHPERYNHKIY